MAYDLEGQYQHEPVETLCDGISSLAKLLVQDDRLLSFDGHCSASLSQKSDQQACFQMLKTNYRLALDLLHPFHWLYQMCSDSSYFRTHCSMSGCYGVLFTGKHSSDYDLSSLTSLLVALRRTLCLDPKC